MRIAKQYLSILIIMLAISVLPRAASAQSGAITTVQVNDAIKIDVWRNAELSGIFTVRSDSVLGHPLYNQVRAVGLTTAELEARLRDFLVRFGANPQFVVTHMMPVSIGGQVEQPDLYMVPVGTTLGTVFGQAGGPTQTANLKKVQLLRSNSRTIINLADANPEAFAMTLHSGDLIVVPRSTNFFREYLVPASSVVAAIGIIVNLIR